MIAQEIRDTLIDNNIGYRSYLTIQSSTSDDIYYDINMPEDNVVYGLDYAKFTPVLWSGWQYHDEIINQLAAENEQLRQRIDKLEKLLLNVNL